MTNAGPPPDKTPVIYKKDSFRKKSKDSKYKQNCQGKNESNCKNKHWSRREQYRAQTSGDSKFNRSKKSEESKPFRTKTRFEVLRCLPQDGRFHERRPLRYDRDRHDDDDVLGLLTPKSYGPSTPQTGSPNTFCTLLIFFFFLQIIGGNSIESNFLCMESNFSTISTLTALHFPLLPILSTPTPLSPLVLPFPHSLPHSPIRMHPGPYGPAPPLPPR